MSASIHEAVTTLLRELVGGSGPEEAWILNPEDPGLLRSLNRLTAEAASLLAREGYDREFGARPLKRVIQRRVQDPLATKLLDGSFAVGDTVVVDVEAGGGIVLRREAAAAIGARKP